MLEDRLAPSADAVQTIATSATTPFSESQQSVQLTAQVTDTTNSNTTVNEGTVKFTVVNSSGQTVGTAATDTLTSKSNGSASVNYGLPANTLVGSYTIEVSYSDTTSSNFSDGGNDQTSTLAVTAATTTTTANSATATFSTSSQDVTLSATVTSNAGTVNEGSVQFTILQGTMVIGTAISGTVSGGSASVKYTLPGGTDAGSYTIKADYSDSSGSFAASSDNSQTLTVTSTTAAATTTTASSITTTFNTSSQDISLSASVTTSGGGTVNEGSVYFKILDSNGNTVGTAATASVTSSGSANVSKYSLPAYTLAGSYTIEADYSDNTGNFAASSDSSQKLTVNAAPTTTTAGSATVTFSQNDQNVTLTANVSSAGGTVNEGSVSFTLFDSNGNTVGTAVSGTVNNGTTSASFTLPGGTAVGSYSILATYSDSAGNFATGSDNTQTLTVNATPTTKLNLTAVQIVPNLSNATTQVTLTAQVSNAAGVVNAGFVSFTLAGVTGQANVVNGTASVQLTVPILDLTGSSNVALSYQGDASASNFARSAILSMNLWNALLPSNLSFDSQGNEDITMLLAGQSLFGYLYSSSGELTQINVESLPLPVAYTDVSGGVLVTIAGIPWQLSFLNSAGQSQGMVTGALNTDGSLVWVVYDSAGHIIGALPT